MHVRRRGPAPAAWCGFVDDAFDAVHMASVQTIHQAVCERNTACEYSYQAVALVLPFTRKPVFRGTVKILEKKNV